MGEARGVEIHVLEEDALTFGTDVLVLKHAQALHGLDAQVVVRADLDEALLPQVDGYGVFRYPTGIGARALLFVGVRPLGQFSYSDIRRFGYKAICSVASSFPKATEIALTLHGVEYGLDEVECFDSEVAGIVDALDAREFPGALRSIAILEVNPGRADRLRAQLEALLGTGKSVSLEPQTGTPPLGARADPLSSAGAGTDGRAHAFVAMPFDPAFRDRFHYGISRAVHANGLLCERIDRQAFTGDILQRLKDQIATSKIVVADLTGANPNVFLARIVR